MNARFSHRNPSSRWLLAGLVALFGFAFASPALAADDGTGSDPVVVVAPDSGDAKPAAPVAPAPPSGADSYVKGGDTTTSNPDSYVKGGDTTSSAPATNPDSYIKG